MRRRIDEDSPRNQSPSQGFQLVWTRGRIMKKEHAPQIIQSSAKGVSLDGIALVRGELDPLVGLDWETKREKQKTMVHVDDE